MMFWRVIAVAWVVIIVVKLIALNFDDLWSIAGGVVMLHAFNHWNER